MPIAWSAGKGWSSLVEALRASATPMESVSGCLGVESMRPVECARNQSTHLYAGLPHGGVRLDSQQTIV